MAAPRTGSGISDKIMAKRGRKAKTMKNIPATTESQRLTTLVDAAKPMLLEDVSTAIPPRTPESTVEIPSAINPSRIGLKSGFFSSGTEIRCAASRFPKVFSEPLTPITIKGMPNICRQTNQDHPSVYCMLPIALKKTNPKKLHPQHL